MERLRLQLFLDCWKQQTLEVVFRDDPYNVVPFFRVNLNIESILVVVNCVGKDLHGWLKVHDLLSLPEVTLRRRKSISSANVSVRKH